MQQEPSDMKLFFTAVDRQGNQREIMGTVDSLEKGFKLLNHLVAGGCTLLTAYVLDKNGRTDLPVAAFDGIPIDIAFAILQTEWEFVLADPLPTTITHYQDVLNLVRRQQINCAQRVSLLAQMIDRYKSWMQRTQEVCSVEKRRIRLLNNYQIQLERHQSQLQVARFQAALLSKRLNQLMGYTP
jgi:hypothetical protein